MKLSHEQVERAIVPLLETDALLTIIPWRQITERLNEALATAPPEQAGHQHTDSCFSRVPETEGKGEFLSCGKVAGDQPAASAGALSAEQVRDLLEPEIADGWEWEAIADRLNAALASHWRTGIDWEAQNKLAQAAEKKDCEKALLALAGWFPTPAETYGFNTSWAISDLCRAVTELRATLAAHDQALKCPICSKPLSSGISWCKTCDVTHAVSCVECHPCGYINTGPCELGKSAAHDQKVRAGGTIGLDGDTKRDWASDGPALEAKVKALRCDSCGQDLSLISRGHYTILCHKPDCYSLKDGHEANVALVKTVRALGLRVRELEKELEGKGAATIR